AAVDFYGRVLGFVTAERRDTDYVVMRLGPVQIDLQPRAHLRDGHPAKPGPDERTGLGIEIVIEVADVAAAYARVQGAGYPLAAPLKPRPWGAADFRVLDPDGRYIRITSTPEPTP
ncbi:MAG: VOC family protein, partial [Anaerolineae bacterium]|nr:VOC family protein [Anaerolineae bacterium]